MELQWPLMIFTLFLCVGAGTFAVAGLMSVRSVGAKLQLPALIVSFGSIVVGGIGSFLHLEHWERIFNGFGHLTSGITQELIALVVFSIVMVIYFIMLRRSDENKLPAWCGWLAVVVSAVLIFVMAHSYNMAARPAWNTPLLWVYYLTNAAAFGGLVMAVLAGAKNDTAASFAGAASLVGTIALAVATLGYAIYFAVAGSMFSAVGNYFDPTMPTKAMVDASTSFTVFSGEIALLFWLGAVLIGAIVPLVCAFLARKKNPKQIAAFAGAGLVCLVIGGLCFRAVLYVLGFSVFLFY